MANTKNTQPDSGFPEKMGQPAHDALAVAGYTKLEQLTGVTEKELLKLHGMGKKGIRMLREALAEKGLSFAPEKSTKK